MSSHGGSSGRAASREVRVEAKGATSSKPGTARFGRPFSRAQARSHVSRAFFTAAAAFSDSSDAEVIAAMAFPDERNHRELVGEIQSALELIGIAVLWIGANGAVEASAQRL